MPSNSTSRLILKRVNDPEILGENREPMHAPWGAYSTDEEALTGDRLASAFVQSLDGVWQFRLFEKIADLPDGFFESSQEENSWADLSVPSNWQLYGYDRAVYANMAMPFAPNPPHAPEENPTGLFKKSFEIPDSWAGREVYLEFGSVDSMLFLWCNGAFVGSSTDSRLPSSFLLTDFLKDGENELVVVVPRFCAGSYLEDQDFWHLSGIQRGVRLIAKTPAHIQDYCVRAESVPGSDTGEIIAKVWMNDSRRIGIQSPYGTMRLPDFANYRIRARLFDSKGNALLAEPLEDVPSQSTPMYEDGTKEAGMVAFQMTVGKVKPWTAETPELYRLVFTLHDDRGRELDRESTVVGFRKLEIRDGILLLNGSRLLLRGVNRHEWNPRTGRVISWEQMRQEILLMKRLNFNAVRTSHYPDDTTWYDLCDELGMYVIDEANLETHAVEAHLSKRPEWGTAFLQRAIRMVVRDRNHPSIICWSLGNESNYGPHHAAMSAWIRFYDPSRPVQYESGYPDARISDIRAPMYPALDWVETEASNPADLRPMILCEYAYCKGNSGGNFWKYWDLVEKVPRFQGAFLWDWADKSLEVTRPDGTKSLVWGGDQGERKHMERMCLNGVVGSFLDPHPAAWEVKHQQSPIRAEWKSEGDTHGLLVKNRFHSLDLAGLFVDWTLASCGEKLSSGTHRMQSVPPGGEGFLPAENLGIDPAAFTHRSDLLLSFSFRNPMPCAWADADHEFGRMQVALSAPRLPCFPFVSGGAVPSLRCESLPDRVRLHCGSSVWQISRTTGVIDSLRIQEKEILHRPVEECFFRVPTDIDHAVANGPSLEWIDGGLHRLEREVRRFEQVGEFSFLVETAHRSANSEPGIHSACTFVLEEDGTLLLNASWKISIPVSTLPRIGWRFALDTAFQTIRWFGRGPWETYPDRKLSAPAAIYESGLASLESRYLYPQESSGRADVRWAELISPEFGSLVVSGTNLLQFSARPHSLEALLAAQDTLVLPEEHAVFVHADLFHAGLGGDTGWTPNIHQEFLLPPGDYAGGLVLAHREASAT